MPRSIYRSTDTPGQYGGLSGLAVVAGALFLVLPVGLTIPLPAFAHLGAVLVDAKPTFQLLSAAPFLGRRVSFTFLLAEVAVPRALFAALLGRIGRLRAAPSPG